MYPPPYPATLSPSSHHVVKMHALSYERNEALLSRAQITWCLRTAPPLYVTTPPIKALTSEHAICIHECSWETAIIHAEGLAVLQRIEWPPLLLAEGPLLWRHGRGWRGSTAATHVELAPRALVLRNPIRVAVDFAINANDVAFEGPLPGFPRSARATRNIADASLGLYPTFLPATTGKLCEFFIAIGVAVISSNHPVGASWAISLLGGGREDLESDEKGGDELHCYRREEVYFCRRLKGIMSSTR